MTLAFLAGCMGGGNQEIQEATFGMTMTVTPDNQTLEDPATLAQDITVTVRSDDGSASKDSRITFNLLNPDSGAQLLVETCVTDKTGSCSTQVIGGDDFGKVANIKVQVAGTNLTKVIKVGIRTKIVPTQIQIIDPPSEIVAGKPFQVGLRLIDDSGRVAEDEEFNEAINMGIEVTARAISTCPNTPTCFNKTSSVDRRVLFSEGIAYVQGVTYNKAEQLTIELYDYNAAIERMEAATGRNFSIAASKTFNIVPDVPVRAQLEPIQDVTTDEKADGVIKIYDQYDNHADNFGGVCSFVVSTSGDNKDEAYIVDQGDSSLRNKTGVASVVSGVGRFDVRDTNVETATVNIDDVNFGCNGITNLGTSETVNFTVGAVHKIVINEPSPNDSFKTTEEAQITIQATDAGGNLNSSFGGLVGIDFNNGCSADINNDDEEVADTKNIRLFQGEKKNIRIFNRYMDRKLVEICTVSLRSTAETVNVPDLTSTIQLKFIPGAPAQFAFVKALYNGEVGWGVLDPQRNRLKVELEQLDTWGNPIIQGGNEKSVRVMSDGDSEINSSGKAKLVTFDSAGKGAFEFYNTKNETINLIMIDGSNDMRFTNANSENIAVEVVSTLYQAQAYFKWGIPTQVVMADPEDGTVDAPITIDFEVQDYGGNRVQDFGTAITPRTDLKVVTDSGTVSLLDPLSFISGQSSIRASNTKEETVTFSMALNDGVEAFKNSKNMEVDFTSLQEGYFKWGLANRRFLIEDPDDGTVDDKITVKVTVVDQFGNPVRDYGCSGVAQDAVVSVNGTAKVTGDANFDHTVQANFNSISQTADLDIKSQAGGCPITDPQSETFKDASYGHVHIFVRTISPYAADFQSVSVSLDPLGTGYAPNPANGISVAFAPGAVTEYRMESNAGTVDDPMEVTVNVLDQFENRVVSYAEDDAVNFSWVFDGSTTAKAYINPNADGIPGNGDDRATDSDGNVTDFGIDFKIEDRGVGKIYVSATYAETYQASLAAKSGYTTNAVADLLFKAGVVTQFDIQPLQAVGTINTDEKAHFGIRAMDQYSNVNLEYVDTNLRVTATKSAQILKNPSENNPDNYILGRPVDVDISAGVGEFYAYDPVKETVTLTVTDTLSRPYSFIPLEVTFLHGDPVQVVIARINTDNIDIPGTMSAATKADSPASIKVEVQDRNGNIADTYDSVGELQLEVAATSGVDNEFRTTLPTQNELPDNSGGNGVVDNSDPISVNITSGEGSVYLLARKVGNVDIFVNPLGSGLDAEPAFDETPVTVNIEHSATKKFAIHPFVEIFNAGGTLSTFPNLTVTGTTDDPISMKISAYDHYTNLATSDNLSEVQVNIDKQAFIVTDSWDAGSTGVGGEPYKSAKLRISGGVGRFSIRDLKKENGIILSMSNPTDPAAEIGHTRPVNITFGAPHYFAIIKPTTTASVDNPYTVDVEVRDQNHNLIHQNFLGEATFQVSGEAFLNDGGDQNPSTGLPASKMTTRLLEWTAGNDGTASMVVWNRKAETITLSLIPGTGKDKNTNSTLVVTDLDKPSELKQLTFVPGYPDRFEIQQPSIYDSFAGIDYHSHADAPVEIEAHAYDKYNNFCNNYSAGDAIQISLTSASNQAYVTTFSSPNDTSSDVMMDFGTAGGFPQGIGKLVIRDKVHENVDVTLVDVDDDAVTWTSNTITVKNMWGAPYMFHLGTIEGTDPYANNSTKELRADVNIEVEAVAKDAYANEVLNFTGKCDFEVVGSQVFYPVNQTMNFVQTSRAKQVYEQRKKGTSIVRLKDNGEAPVMQDYNQHPVDAQRTVEIVPGKPEKFGFIDPLLDKAPADITADKELLVTIEAQDKWGNRAITFGGVGADVQVRYAGGTGQIENPTTNVFSSSPVAFTFTAGAATINLKNEILDRAVTGAKNEPLKGETVTMGFLPQSSTASYTNDTSTDMDTSAELDITFLPDVAKRLEVVDYAGAGPYKVDDPVELRVEARDQFGNYTDDYTGNFTLFVDKNAWTYQGPVASNYKYLPTENLDGQDVGQKEQQYMISSNGWVYVNVANLTAENNVTINAKLAQGEITNYDPVLVSWTYGTGVYYDIVFLGQEAVPIPQFTTDLVRNVEVRVLDKGGNLVQNYTSHQVRMKSDEITAEFEGDDAGDDGLINVIGGVGPFQYRTRDDVISTVSIDTAAPGRHNGMAAGTKQVKFNPGTVSQLVFANIPSSISADDVIISDAAVYTDSPDDYNNYPVTCTTSPGQQTCSGGPAAGGPTAGYPVHELRIEPQDKYGNINKGEGDNKAYQVQVKAHVQGAPAQVIWSDTIQIVNGIAWKTFTAGNQAANELWTRRLFKSQDVTFVLSNPLPTSQPDEANNTIPLDVTSTFDMNVTPGNATRLFIKPVSDSTIDFKIPITIEAQDAHDSDGNGNGNLVTNAPEMTVGLEFYSPTGFDPAGIDGTTGFSNGSVVSVDSVQAYNQAYVNGDAGQKDIRDAQDPTGDDAGSVSFVTIRKGIGIFGVEHLKAESVVVSLFDAAGGTNEGDNGIYFTRLNVPSNPKEFEFTPGAPKKYKIGLIDSTGSVYTDTDTHALNDFRYEVRAYDRGQNFTPAHNGWAYVTATNSGGGALKVFGTPDPGQDDGASILETDGNVNKNVALVNGIGAMKFQAEKAGTVTLSLTSTSGLDMDPNNPEVTVNAGPGYEIVIIDPNDIAITNSSSVADYGDNSKLNLSLIEIRGLDYYQNIANDLTGTVVLKDANSTTMQAVDGGGTQTFVFPSFVNGSDAIKSLRLRNRIAEDVKLEFESSNVKNANGDEVILPGDTSSSDNPLNVNQNIVFSPGPTAQLSLEINEDLAGFSGLDNLTAHSDVKNNNVTTDANSDVSVPMTVRTRDIYGNWNTSAAFTNEAQIVLTPRQGSAVALVNDLTANETLSISGGKVDFNVKLQDFGTNGSYAPDAREYGVERGMDFIDVSVSSATQGFVPFKQGGTPGEVLNPRRLYYHAGSAIALTLDPIPDSTTDDYEDIVIYARDQFGNVDARYGGAGCDRSVKVKIWKDAGHTEPATDATIYDDYGNATPSSANEDLCIINGVARGKIGSTRTGRVYLTMEEGVNGLNGVSPTTLNPHMDGKGTLSTTRDFDYAPGAPAYFVFTETQKGQYDYIDINGGAPTDIQVQTDSTGSRITVDNAAYFYAYMVDQGGNRCYQIDSNDRVTVSANRPDASINTLDPLYGDFVDGEAVFIIGREKSMESDGYLNVTMNLKGSDVGNITTNMLQIDFDHGKTTNFAWIVPASATSIDTIALLNIQALDQYGNNNDNYAGNATFTASTSDTFNGDTFHENQPYEPSVAGDPSDVDPSDVNYTGAGLIRQFSGGSLTLEVMSLRAYTYTMTLANAQATIDSNGAPVGSNASFSFKHGNPVWYEIIDPITYSDGDQWDSSKASIDINISAHDNTSDLTTDYYANIGVLALDRGFNQVSQHSQTNAFTIEAYDTSNNKIIDKIDFVAAGGTPYQNAIENTERAISFNNDFSTIIEMRAKRNITYELRLKSIAGGVVEKNPSTGATDKYITFKNGSLAQVVFTNNTPNTADADKTFTIEIEGQDQYGNKAEDYTGWVGLGLDEGLGGGILRPGDVGFSSVATFPDGGGATIGDIQIIKGTGSLAGFKYSKTNAYADRPVTFHVFEVSNDFDPTVGINMTPHKKTINITAGDPTQIVFAANPSDALVDTNAQFKLRIEDGEGNLCYLDQSKIDVTISGLKYGFDHKKIGGSAGANTVSGGNEITIVNGETTFNLWSQKADTVDITMSNPQLAVSLPVPTKGFDFYADQARELIFTANDYETPSPQGVTPAGVEYSLYVIGRDQFQNTASGFTGTAEVRIYTGGDVLTVPATASSTFPIVKNLNFIDGKATVNVASEAMTTHLGAGARLEFRFGNFTGSPYIERDYNDGGDGDPIDDNHRHFLHIDHNDATEFRWSSNVSTASIDDAVRMKIEAIDDYGNLVDDYTAKTADISTTSNYPYYLGSIFATPTSTPSSTTDENNGIRLKTNTQTLSFTDGEAYMWVGTAKAETPIFTILSADNFDVGKPMATAATGSVSFTYGAATYFLIKNPPSNGTVDAPVEVVIQASDRSANSNISPAVTPVQLDLDYATADAVQLDINGVSNPAVTATWASGDAALADGVYNTSALLDFSGGEGRAQVRSEKMQDVNLTLSASVGPDYDGNDKVLPFDHGAWHHMEFKSAPPVATTDDQLTIYVEAVDQYRNKNDNINGDIKVISTTGKFLDGTVVSGGSEVSIANFGTLTLNKGAGSTPLIQVKDSGKTSLNGAGENTQTVTFKFANGDITVPNPNDPLADHDITVKHGQVAKYKLLGSSQTAVPAGTDIVQSVQILDANANLVWDLSVAGIDPSVQFTAKVGGGNPSLLYIDGVHIANGVKNLDESHFTGGTAEVVLNSKKAQTVALNLVDTDGDADTGIQVMAPATFKFEPDGCSRVHFAVNGSWTPSNSEDLSSVPGTNNSVIAGTVDDDIAVVVELHDKHGNFNNTCTQEVTLVASNWSDGNLEDWDATKQPKAYNVTSGSRSIPLLNKKGKSSPKLSVEIGVASISNWGTNEKVTLEIDHGKTTSLDLAVQTPSLPPYTVDDDLTIRVQAYDKYGNINDNYGSSEAAGATVYFSVDAADASGPTPGPFMGAADLNQSSQHLTTPRKTGTFANGYVDQVIQNWNAGNFTLKMQNATNVGAINVDESATLFISLESGNPKTYEMDEASTWEYCTSDPSKITGEQHPYSNDTYTVQAGCHPKSPASISDELEFGIKAFDRGGNEAVTFNGPGPTVVLDGSSNFGNLTKSRVLDMAADPSLFASTTNYNDGGATDTAQITLTNGVGGFSIGNQKVTYNCNSTRGGYPKCGSQQNKGYLGFYFTGCTDGCSISPYDGGTWRTYFGPGKVKEIIGWNVSPSPSGSGISVDDDFQIDLVALDGLGHGGHRPYNPYKGYVVEDYVGTVSISADDSSFACSLTTSTEMDGSHEGIKALLGSRCTKIPLDGDGKPQMSANTSFTIGGTGGAADTTLDLKFRPGVPTYISAEGMTFTQVEGLGTNSSSNWAKITVSLRDQYGNVTNQRNSGASVTLNTNSTDGGRLAISSTGTGAGSANGSALYTLNNFVNGQQTIYIRSEVAETLSFSLSGQDGFSNVLAQEGTAHQVTFGPGPAATYQIVNDLNGAGAASARTDDWTTLRVEALDVYGNIATGENNKTVTVGSTLGSFSTQNPSGSVVIVNGGTGTIEVRNTIPGTSIVTMSNPSNGSVSVAGSSVTISNDPGVPRYIKIIGSSLTGYNNNADKGRYSGIPIKFDLLDQFENPTRPYSGSVTANIAYNQTKTYWGSWENVGTLLLSWNTGHTPGSQKTGYLYTSKATNHNLSVTATSGSGVDAGLDTDGPYASKGLTVYHGAAKHLYLSTQDSVDPWFRTDQNRQVDIRVRDEFGNLCNTANTPNQSVTLQANAGSGAVTYVKYNGSESSGSKAGTTSGGVATFFLRSTKYNTTNLSATHSTLANANDSIRVEWGTPNYIQWSVFDGNKYTGDSLDTYTASIYDALGHHLTGYSTGSKLFPGISSVGSMKLNTSMSYDGALIESQTPPSVSATTVNWSGGSASVNVSNFTYAGAFTMTASDSSSGASPSSGNGTILIKPDGATKTFIAAPTGKGIVSQSQDVTVYLIDDYNNFAKDNTQVTLCVRPSNSIPTTRYDDDSHVATDGYFNNPGTLCKTKTYTNQSVNTFTMNANISSGFGWVEAYVSNTSDAGISNTAANDGGHEDFYFQPGDPVKYELVLPTHAESGKTLPAASHFHSSVSTADRDSAHLVTGVARTVKIKAVDVTGAVASTWGGVATISLGGDAQFASEQVTVDLTQGEGAFDIYDQFVENVHMRVVGSSDNTVSYYGVTQGPAAVVCDTCEINLKVVKSKAHTFKVTSVNNGPLTWPDAAPNKARQNHNDTNKDKFDITYEILDEGGSRFKAYSGKFRNDPAYYNPFSDFKIANGIKTGQWGRNYYPATRTPSFGMHSDYGGRSINDMQVANTDYDTVYFVHDSPVRIYVYCPVDMLVSDTASIANCRLRLTDNQYHRSSTSHVPNDTWGTDVTNFDGGSIDINLKNNSNVTHPNAILYWDTDHSNSIEQSEIDATGEAQRGQVQTLNFQAGRGKYYFGINSAQSGNVKITMENGVYNGSKWHTYLGGSANTNIALDGINGPIKYQVGDYIDQTVFFQEAPTTTMEMSVTASDDLVNPTNDGSEYYEVTVTAKIANGTVNINEDGYVYLDAQCHGAQSVGYLEGSGCSHYTWMRDVNGGGYADTNSKLGQFVDGVATFRVFAKTVGDLKLHLRHPGSSSVPFVDNDEVVNFDSNPATKYIIVKNYDTPGDGNWVPDRYVVRADGQPHNNNYYQSYKRLEIRAVDDSNRIDVHYNESSVPITISCAQVLSTDNCSSDLSNGIDGNLDGTAGDNTVTFVKGRAKIDSLSLEVGEYTITATDGSAASFGSQASGSVTFQALWPKATKLVELVGNRDETVQGKVTFFYEARDDFGNLAGDTVGSFSISYDVNDGTLSGSSDGMFFVGGISSYNLESSKGQTVMTTFTDVSMTGMDIIGDVDGTPTANQNKYTFVGGKAVGIRVQQQPIGNVVKDNVFEQAMVLDVIDADDSVVTTGADSETGVVVTAYSGAGCVAGSEIVDGSVTENGSTDLNRNASSGTISWTNLKSSVAQEISFKVKDENSRWPGYCTTGLTVYDTFAVAVDGAVTGAQPQESVIIEITGGVPPYNLNITAGDDSIATFVTNAEPGCDGSTCVKYLAGRELASDSIQIFDSQVAPAANSSTIPMDVQAASFTFDDNDAPTAWSTVATNDLGQFTADSDQSYIVRVLNDAAAFSSGALSMVLSATHPSMWTFLSGGCDLNDANSPLAAGSSCNSSVTFNANSGTDGPGVYTATLTVSGHNGSSEETIVFQAEVLDTLEIQDANNAYVDADGTTVLWQNLTSTNHHDRVFRIRNNSTATSGTLEVEFDTTNDPAMWSVVSNTCMDTPTDLNFGNPGKYCEITIRYEAQTGTGSTSANGPHEATINVSSPNLGTSSVTIRANRI